jgi:hypothetical protein
VRIEAGTQAEADLAQTTAEVERRRGEVMVARENLIRAENALRNLIARDADDPIWNAPLSVPRSASGSSGSSEELDLPRNSEDLRGTRGTADAIAIAFANRPELQELVLRLDRHDVEIDAAVDRVRPQLCSACGRSRPTQTFPWFASSTPARSPSARTTFTPRVSVPVNA